jgi:hypothetical protein
MTAIHPAAQSAQDAWGRLHGHKFHKNAMAKKTISGPTHNPTAQYKPKIVGAAAQKPARANMIPPVKAGVPKTSNLAGAVKVNPISPSARV